MLVLPKYLKNMVYKFPNEQQAILRTLLYSDIFSFPVMKDELWQFLLSKQIISSVSFTEALAILVKKKHIVFLEGYYCLPGKEKSIAKRKHYVPEVQKKLLLAKKVASILSNIPTIECIGLSGGLAVKNATENDDIDFFVITKRGTLFTTRLWIACTLHVMGLRRTWKEKNAANKICVNFLIDETQLTWPIKRHDVYTAREIAQLKPLYNRDNTYEHFIQANAWIKRYLPQWEQSIQLDMLNKKHHRLLSPWLMWNPAIERIFRIGQQLYMKQHRTTEQIENSVLAFHPNDYRSKILRELSSKWEQFGLLTKF